MSWGALLLGLLLGAWLVPLSARDARAVGDTVEATMAGEFALQAGKLDDAARWYLVAARASQGDVGLAERAARISLLADDDARSRDAIKLWRQRAPDSLALQTAEVTLALRQGDQRAARRGLEKLLRHRDEDPDQDGWRYALAALGGGRNPGLTATLLGDVVDAGLIPDQLQAWLAFGGLAQQLGQEVLTERIVDAVVARFPGEPRVALLRASQLREASQPDQARQVLAGLEEATLLSADLRLSVAAEYEALGAPGKAAAVLARGTQDDRSYRVRASLLARVNDTAALDALYAELQRDSSNPDPQRRLLLGQTAEFLERYDEALGWYRSVPGGGARLQAGLRTAAVLHQMDRKDEAFADLRGMQADGDVEEEARLGAYLLEAQLWQEDEDGAGELDAYARGLAAFPDEAALLYSRALSWERRDDIPRAEADLRRILVADPDNTTALNALGYTLADRTRRYAEALQLIDRARVAEPQNAAIVDSYGWVLYRLGRNQEALVQLRRAYALQKDPEIAAHLGEVLWQTGDKAEARRLFEESRKLDPDNRALQRALAETGA